MGPGLAGWAVAWAGPPTVDDALQALEDGRLLEAEVALTEIVETDAANVRAQWELGWVRYTQRDFAGAADAWERVSLLDPAFPELALWRDAARTRAAYVAGPMALEEVALQASGGPIRVVAGGDTMMGSDLGRPDGLPQDPAALFAGLQPVLSAADVTFVNLEGTLADGLGSAKCQGNTGTCYAFRSPTRFAPLLADAGVDVVSLANNHAFDLGFEGYQSTAAALAHAGVAYAGRYGDVATVEARGLRIAVVAAHSGTCCLSVNDLDEVRAAVRLADQDHDLVVLSFHGGAEGAKHRHVPGVVEVAWGERRGDVRALAHAAVDAGADLVIGHGPHVLRAVEVYRGRLIAYSLGNLLGYRVFGRAGGYGRRTVLVDAELAANGVLVSAKLHPVALDGRSVPSLDASGAAWRDVQELIAADFPDAGTVLTPDGTLRWEVR